MLKIIDIPDTDHIRQPGSPAFRSVLLQVFIHGPSVKQPGQGIHAGRDPELLRLHPESSFLVLIQHGIDNAHIAKDKYPTDDVDDIVLLSLSTQKNPSNFKVLQYSETEKKPVARYAIELDPEIINFKNITFGTIAQNQKGIVIDSEKNGGILTSQIVFFDEKSNTFLNPLVTENENGTFSNPTARKDTIYSRDADGDSIIETPVVTPMPAPAENTSLNICSITAWKQYSVYNKALGTKINTVINYNDRYYITVPNRWINNTITAVTDTDTRKMTFYIWNSKTSSFGDKLLEISRYTKDEFEKLDTSNIISLNIENPNAVFCAEIFITNSNDELNITPEEVTNSVHEFWKN